MSYFNDLAIMLEAEITISSSVRRSIPRRAIMTLIQPLVISKVDYCNSVLAGVSDTLLRRLLIAVARLVFSQHITSLLREVNSIG